MSGGGKIADSPRRVPPEGPASAGPRWPRRHHPVHLSPNERFNRSTIILVTAATAGRRQILASEGAREAIVAAWSLAGKWAVGRYVLMPDHLHFFCAPNEFEAPSLEKWMRCWKSIAPRKLGEKSGTVWQRHHWDRQLRRSESYDEKWEYVCRNPVRHGLVSKAEAWPYQGELNELRW